MIIKSEYEMNKHKNKKRANEMILMLDEFFSNEELTSGQVIRSKRKNYGITLAEVEEATGISQTNLSLYENDKKSLGIVQATKIGLAIGLHPMTILFPNGIEADKRFSEIIKRSRVLLNKKKMKVS